MRFLGNPGYLLLSLAPLLYGGWACADSIAAFHEIVIVPGAAQTELEARYAALLEQRLPSRGPITVSMRDAPLEHPGKRLTILIGVPERHPLLEERLDAQRIAVPDVRNPGGEGFLLRSVPVDDGLEVWAAAADSRGMLFAAGEILRRLNDLGDAIEFPANLDLRTAPAFELRGTQVIQGNTMQELTGARDWTPSEREAAILDYALAGTNTFHVSDDEYDLIKSYGLKAHSLIGTNAGQGPPEWQAIESIGRQNYLCPSVPEARQHLLDRLEARMENSPSWDYLRFNSGDGGGCECEDCAPYGGTYMRLLKDMAEIVHRHHPNTKITATNQKLDNAGERAMFDFLRENPGDWLWALCYTAGSNAMSWQPGRRQDHRMDLFRYPAFGEMDRYLREMLHELQPDTAIKFHTGVTHWIYAQYGLISYHIYPDRDHESPSHWSSHIYSQRPDPTLTRVYHRRTFYARPQNYYNAFRETMRYAVGDMTYSEGIHDHFNNWMWQRLMWDPHQELEDVVAGYARAHFGRDAAPMMAEAIFQLERNLTESLATNEGIGRYHDLVREAGATMPAHLMEDNYLWRQHMQRALLDKYIQAKLQRQLAIEKQVVDRYRQALADGSVAQAVEQAAQWLEQDVETEEMRAWKEEAGRLGEESDALFGVRSEGYFALDRDLVDLGWLRGKTREAQGAAQDEQRAILAHVVHYEDPGEGGFYDNAGDPDNSPNLVYGWARNIPGAGHRHSQSTAAYTLNEPRGVTFEYRGLDPEAKYRIRFTLVRPLLRSAPGRQPRHHPQSRQSIYAGGHILARDLELPVGTPEFFEFDIPNEAIEDGRLTVWFEPDEALAMDEWPPSRLTTWTVSGGWGTLVSEVWLTKR